MFSKLKSKFSSNPGVTTVPVNQIIPSNPSNLRTVCTDAEANAAATRFEIAANKIDQAAIRIDGAAEKITNIVDKFGHYTLPSVPEDQESYPSLTSENLENLQVPSRNVSRTNSLSSIPSSQISQVSEELRKLNLNPSPSQLSRTNSISSTETPEYLNLPSSEENTQPQTSDIEPPVDLNEINPQIMEEPEQTEQTAINKPPTVLPPPVPQGVPTFTQQQEALQQKQEQEQEALQQQKQKQKQEQDALQQEALQQKQEQEQEALQQQQQQEQQKQALQQQQQDLQQQVKALQQQQAQQKLPEAKAYETKEAIDIIKKYNNEEYLSRTLKNLPINEYIKSSDISNYDNYFLFIDKTNSDYYVIGKNIEYFYPFKMFGDQYPVDEEYKYAIQFDSIFGYIDYISISKLQDNYYFIFPIINFDAEDNDPNEVQLYEDLEKMFDLFKRTYNTNPKFYETELLEFMRKTNAYIPSVKFPSSLNLSGIISKDEIMKKINSKPGLITKKINKMIHKIPFKFSNITRKLNPFGPKSGGRRPRRTRRVPRKRRVPRTTKGVPRKRRVPRTTRRVSRKRTTKRNNNKRRVSKRRTKKYIKKNIKRNKRTKRNIKRRT